MTAQRPHALPRRVLAHMCGSRLTATVKLLLMLVRILLASAADSWTRGKPDQPSVWMKCPECGDRKEYAVEPVTPQFCYGPGPDNSQTHPERKRKRD